MIFYLIPDHAEPSWGVGMLYEHVRLLRGLGREACALHHRSGFLPGWIEPPTPLRYLDEPAFAPTPADTVVLPEILAAAEAPRRHPWRRVVFVQGSFLIAAGLGEAADYPALGIDAAMAVLPHVAHVVERHFGLRATVVPPYVAPFFFDPPPGPRERRVLLAVKEGYRQAGIPDGAIAGRLLAREIACRPSWSLVELAGLAHRQVAALMATSEFLVNVNSHEAFNTTVPEAMAAGCIPVCYEAGGGRDFLRDGVNAVVFANQQVYALVEKLCTLLDDFDGQQPFLERLRQGGRETAAAYRPELTAAALDRFFATP